MPTTHNDSILNNNLHRVAHQPSPLALLIAVIREQGGNNKAEQTAEFFRKLDEDEDIRHALYDEWTRLKFNTAFAAANPPSLAELQRRREEAKRERKKVKALKTKIVGRMLTLTMANGKALGDCTGADCKSFGGWLLKVGERVGARKLVKNVLTERQLKSIFASK